MERELGQEYENPIQREAFLKDNCDAYLPESFKVEMPIFKGMQPETIEVETFAQVDGREVSFILLSPGAQATLEDLRNKVVDEQLEQIKEIAPEIAIIEI